MPAKRKEAVRSEHFRMPIALMSRWKRLCKLLGVRYLGRELERLIEIDCEAKERAAGVEPKSKETI